MSDPLSGFGLERVDAPTTDSDDDGMYRDADGSDDGFKIAPDSQGVRSDRVERFSFGLGLSGLADGRTSGDEPDLPDGLDGDRSDGDIF